MPVTEGILCFFDEAIDKKKVTTFFKRKASSDADLGDPRDRELNQIKKKRLPEVDKECGVEITSDSLHERHLTKRLQRISIESKKVKLSKKSKSASHRSDASTNEIKLGNGRKLDGNSGLWPSISKSDSDADSGICDDDTCRLEMPQVLKVSKEKCISLDCEFVGVGPGKTSALGRCSIVSYHGEVLCDIYVKPSLPITDYRTPWSGITRDHLRSAIPLENAQNIILPLIQGKLVVGHALHNDFSVMHISHPPHLIRDTSSCAALKMLAKLHHKQPVSLKRLSLILLGRHIQKGRHCSVEDARAAISLYRLVEHQWESYLSTPLSSSKQKKHKIISNQTSLRHRTSSESNSYLDDTFWPQELLVSDMQ